MRTYVERLADAPYVDCATTTSYNSVSVPAGFTAASSTEVLGWDQPEPRGLRNDVPDDRTRADSSSPSRLTRNADGQKDSLVIVKRDEVQP